MTVADLELWQFFGLTVFAVMLGVFAPMLFWREFQERRRRGVVRFGETFLWALIALLLIGGPLWVFVDVMGQ